MVPPPNVSLISACNQRKKDRTVSFSFIDFNKKEKKEAKEVSGERAKTENMYKETEQTMEKRHRLL